MALKIQLISFLVSYLYGMFFYIMLEINSKFLYSSNIFVKVIGSFLFVVFHTLLYFLLLMKINYGCIHFYFFLCILFGFIICKVVYKKFVKGKNLWYTLVKIRMGDLMVKKRNRYTVKAKGRMFIIFLFFGAVIATFGFTFLHDLKRINDMNKELRQLKVLQKELLDEEESIEADIKRLSDPLYVARYAREKYFYSKEGEIILRIKGKKSDN